MSTAKIGIKQNEDGTYTVLLDDRKIGIADTIEEASEIMEALRAINE